MQKAVSTQQRQVLHSSTTNSSNAKPQLSDQNALLSQLKSVSTVTGSNQDRNMLSSTVKSTGPSSMVRQSGSAEGNMFEFVPVHSVQGSKYAGGSSTASSMFPPQGRVSHSTRHAGKNFDRVNLSSTNQAGS